MIRPIAMEIGLFLTPFVVYAAFLIATRAGVLDPNAWAFPAASQDAGLGAMRTLYDRGYRIPGDVAVVGFDDIDDGRYNVPSLTTISPDKAGIAHSALRLLLERIEAVDSSPREVTVSHELRIRESSGAGPRRPV